ncbi:MAG: cytochrome c oxidase assembly protein [Caldilineaceae bacterium]|nr:cytochrome c oxidase assembly protein [Caldilineaceae bacterium]
MHPLLRALLSTWDWRFDASLVLSIFAILYTTGWWQLRRRKRIKLANRRRLVAYWSGLITLAISLMSPIAPLGGQLFFMHMLQHMITIMVSAPLLWLGAPFPFLMWGLPTTARRWVVFWIGAKSPIRGALTFMASPAFVWFAFVAVYGGWHDPILYDQSLRYAWVHDLQHITFFATAMLFWWIIIDAAPYLHRTSLWGRLAMLIGVIPVNMAIGIVIATAQEVIYPYYATVPRIWGLTALDDQSMAGVIMWTSGSEMLVLAVVFVLAGALRGKDKKPPGPVTGWDQDEAMIAPGLEHRVTQNKWRQLKTTPTHPSSDAS